MFKFSNYKKNYGSHSVLDGITLEIKAGEIIGLIGRNGVGKSTLFGMITGSIKKTDGCINYDNIDITYKPDIVKSKIGIQLEKSAFYPNLSVQKNLYLLASLKREKRSEIDKLVELLGLKEKFKKKFITLSQGQKKRVSILSALLGKPELILFDEPTVNLDPEGIYLFYNIVKKLKETNKAIIISSHLLTDISKIADRLVLINEGKIVLDKPKKQILTPKYIVVKTSFLKQTQKLLQKLYYENEILLLENRVEINYYNIELPTIINQLVNNSLPPNEVYLQKKSLMDVFNENC